MELRLTGPEAEKCAEIYHFLPHPSSMRSAAVLLQLLAVLCLLSVAIKCHYLTPWEAHGMRSHTKHKIYHVITKCCPRDQFDRPLFCCKDGLPGGYPEDEQPLKECADNREMGHIEIFRTIQCAQREFLGEAAASICSLPCCEFFENSAPAPRGTACSRACARAAISANTTRAAQSAALRALDCDLLSPIRFQAFLECAAKEKMPVIGEDLANPVDRKLREICDVVTEEDDQH